MMPCCNNISRLSTSACASRHAPCVPCWIAFIIICPAALCLLLIILVMMGWLQPDSMWQVPSDFQQMGQIGGPSIWLHWAARFWLYIKSVRQSMTISLLQRLHLHFSKVSYLCPSQQCLPLSVLSILCSTLWTDGINLFYLGPSGWTYMCAFTASRAEQKLIT